MINSNSLHFHVTFRRCDIFYLIYVHRPMKWRLLFETTLLPLSAINKPDVSMHSQASVDAFLVVLSNIN